MSTGTDRELLELAANVAGFSDAEWAPKQVQDQNKAESATLTKHNQPKE